MLHAAVGAANFLFIFLKAFQQRNVAFMHYRWVLPTSFAMAITEVGVVGAVALEATRSEHFMDLWPLVAAIGIGGGLGCIASMYIHFKYVGVRHDNVEG